MQEHLTMIVRGNMISCNEKTERVMPTSQDPTHTEGVEIRIARIRAGVRQYEVAMSVGISPARLSEIEAGRRRPSPELLERILAVIRGGHNGDKKQQT